ncbi:hypothetical protein ACFX15_011632 [Malus domestica]
MLSLSHVLFSSAGEVEIEGVVITEVLVELLNIFLRLDMTVTVQCLKGPTVEERFQVDIRRMPREGRVDRDPGCRSPQNGSDIQDGGTNGTQRNDHCVGGRAPEAQSGLEKLLVGNDFHRRKKDGVVDAKSLPLLAEESFHSNDPGCPGCGRRGPGALGLSRIPSRPFKPLKQGCLAVLL